MNFSGDVLNLVFFNVGFKILLVSSTYSLSYV